MAESAAHQHVPGVDHQHHQHHHQKAGIPGDHGDAAVLPGRGVVQQAEQKTLKGAEMGGAAGDLIIQSV